MPRHHRALGVCLRMCDSEATHWPKGLKQDPGAFAYISPPVTEGRGVWKTEPPPFQTAVAPEASWGWAGLLPTF